jgi:hypothetical protein
MQITYTNFSEWLQNHNNMKVVLRTGRMVSIFVLHITGGNDSENIDLES